ncbi:unnamed protein product, partial [Effrenium voratum]
DTILWNTVIAADSADSASEPWFRAMALLRAMACGGLERDVVGFNAAPGTRHSADSAEETRS